MIAEGVLVVQRMLASRFRPRAMLGTDRRLRELAADLEATDAPYYRVTAEVMADVVGFHLNRGVLAAAPRPGELTVDQVLDGARTVAVLEGVNDHENLGSIFRNAAGLGVDAVVFGTGCADPLYRRAVRVSMGHVLLVPYAWAAAWPADLKVLRDRGFRVLAMTPDPACAHAVRGDGVGRRRSRRDSRRRRRSGPDRDGDAGQRYPGSDPDVTWHRFAECGDGRSAGVLRAG